MFLRIAVAAGIGSAAVGRLGSFVSCACLLLGLVCVLASHGAPDANVVGFTAVRTREREQHLSGTAVAVAQVQHCDSRVTRFRRLALRAPKRSCRRMGWRTFVAQALRAEEVELV